MAYAQTARGTVDQKLSLFRYTSTALPPQIERILVESLVRLARDLMIQESILHDLKRHGFQLVSVAEPDLCSDDPSRKLMRQIMGAFHEYEKQMIVVKLRGARQRTKIKNGRCEGRKPYGAHPSEAET